MLLEAEQVRKKTIEQAVAQAQGQGQKEIDALKSKAQKERAELSRKAEGRKEAAVQKVLDYLKG